MIVAEVYDIYIVRAFAKHVVDLHIHILVAKAKICWTKCDRSVRDKALPVCDKGPGRVCMVHTNTRKDHIPRSGTRLLGDRAIWATRILRQFSDRF